MTIGRLPCAGPRPRPQAIAVLPRYNSAVTHDDVSPPNGVALIEVEDFHKSYRDTVAVQGLSFVVEPGQIVGLLGPNGAGKTTTMRVISGIIPPTRGRLRVAGHD